MEQKTIIIIICLIAVVGLVIFLVYPKYQDLAFSRKQLDQKKQELERQQDYFSQINSASEKLSNYQDKLDKIESALPEQASLPELYNYFQKVTSQNGLILSALTVGQPQNSLINPYIQDIDVSVSAAGSYSSLKNFLSSLYKNSRMVELESISFSGGGEEKGQTGKQKTGGAGIFDFSFKLKVHSYTSISSLPPPQTGQNAPEETELTPY